MRSCLLTVFSIGLLIASSHLSLANEGGPVYQRSRQHAGGQRGGGFHPGYPGWGGAGWGWPGFYNPPVVVGSWYQRPYPTHLDYVRLRQRTPLAVPHLNCPTCAAPTVVESVE